jgi:hypothetical protein
MNAFRLALVPAVALAFTLPLAAQANSVWHAANGEAGVTYHPEHFRSAKTRAQVMAEVDAARQDGTLALLQRGAPVSVKSSEPPKTRQQVIAEMRAESPDARRARLELLTGG